MTIKITDTDIRYGIEYAITEAVQDGQINVPDAEYPAFLEDCVNTVLDGIEMYDRNPFLTEEQYTEVVLDMADTYGFIK